MDTTHVALLIQHGEIFCYQVRIPETARASRASSGLLVVRQGWLVGARGAQCIVNVHYLKDAGRTGISLLAGRQDNPIRGNARDGGE